MARETIAVDQFLTRIYHLWDKQWFLLTSGDFARGHYNTMTVSWGSMGVMWNRPFVQVVVRPTRYTHQFMEQYGTFTLCAFSDTYRKALNLLGSRSGRDGDKIAQAGLTPIASTQVAAPAFAEAELILECKKMYWDDFDPTHFLDPKIEENYAKRDYHRVYFGQVMAIYAEAAYR
ncbi:MAG: flavin reductase [Thermoflexales bacterium]|nr:flavin reductase [Thermoflexales bacterium]